MLSLTNKNNSGYIDLTSAVILIVLIGLIAIGILNHQNITDWFKLRGYALPEPDAALASGDSMTPKAVKLFKLNHPIIEDKANFQKNCPNNGGEQTIVLGCYKSDEDGIYLLNVSDPLLSGVMQVTAAHEMLHAAYERLSPSQRSYIDGLLLDYYHHGLKDPRIINSIAVYQRTEPNAVVNEMHSVFGTEVANLPPALEEYYATYFSDRQVITNFAAKYENEFTSRQTIVANDDSLLSAQRATITSLESDLNTKLTTINSLDAQLNSDKAAGNIPSYNALVEPYDNQVNQYNAEVEQVKSLVASYNQLVDNRNSVALFDNMLYSELSGNQLTAHQQL